MNNTGINYLTWDSDFFGKKTGQVPVKNTNHIVSVLQRAKEAGYQLIYVFGNRDFFIDEKILKQFNGRLVNRRVLYEKRIGEIKAQPLIVSEYKSDKLTPELEQLAYESGKYSRFRLDENFTENDFYRMYKIWIENSLKRKTADKVFVVEENGQIKGMITLKIMEKEGHNGLLAVLPGMKGKGYGKALISACESELLSKGIHKLKLPTQLENKQACKFYEKCGLQAKEITNVYHFWL